MCSNAAAEAPISAMIRLLSNATGQTGELSTHLRPMTGALESASQGLSPNALIQPAERKRNEQSPQRYGKIRREASASSRALRRREREVRIEPQRGQARLVRIDHASDLAGSGGMAVREDSGSGRGFFARQVEARQPGAARTPGGRVGG